MIAQDPWSDRLSEYLDGELDGEERAALEAHLPRCAHCRTLLSDLRRLALATRALREQAPEHDLWPALAHMLAPARKRPFPRWLLAFAAGVALTLGVAWIRRLPVRSEERVAAAGETYLLLLHEPAGLGAGETPAEHATVVARYSGWAEELGRHCLGGEELAEGGLELRAGGGGALVGPISAGEHVGGYFLLATRDQEEALELARSCPHLERGGWLELRRIQTR